LLLHDGHVAVEKKDFKHARSLNVSSAHSTRMAAEHSAWQIVDRVPDDQPQLP